jgi:mono/diheme cytochrome c family protein
MRLRLAAICLLSAGAALWTCGAGATERFPLPEGPGRDLVYGHCQTCHDLQSVVDSAGIRRGAWDAVLDNMRQFGLRISDAQRAAILDYLGSYLGPNPPPETAAPEGGPVDGAQVFGDTCIACHEADGKGKPGKFPPLAANPDLFLAPDFPVFVALNGIRGPIVVDGQSFDNVMPPFDFLSDDEIAAVITYVRTQWGNDKLAPAGATPVDANAVAVARKKSLTAQQVHELRQSLLK